MKRLVYFGSAFNPPHLGHMQCMAWLCQLPNVALVLAGPSKTHAFAKDMVDFEARCEMTQKLMNYCLLPANVKISRIEQDIARNNQPVYTYDVLVALQSRYPDYRIVFGLGPDNVEHFTRFYRHADILAEFELEECPTMGTVRSTDLRNAAKAGNVAFIAQNIMPELVPRVLQLYC